MAHVHSFSDIEADGTMLCDGYTTCKFSLSRADVIERVRVFDEIHFDNVRMIQVFKDDLTDERKVELTDAMTRDDYKSEILIGVPVELINK